MHVNISLIDIIFHFCLFGLLIHTLINPIKQYVIPLLYNLLNKEKNQQMEIIEKDKLLTSTQLRLQNQIKQQKKSFVVFERNIQKWYKAQQHNANEQEQINRLRTQALNDRRTRQRKEIYASMLLKKALPEALIKAEKEIIAFQKTSSNSFSAQSIQHFLQSTVKQEKEWHDSSL